MASSVHRWNYDVFLSFRGEDTRKNFTDHLYTALDRAGIYTFRDDEELKRGKEISSELQTAIEESRISIVVFSRNYASSRWCLDELLKILYCNETMGQLVFPVFYDVEPSEVRNQTGSFGSGFSQTKKRVKADLMKVQSWETALRKAANLSGWDLQKVDNGHEAKCVWRIVEEVLTKLNQVHLDVAVFPVGIDSRVQCVESLLNVRLNGVCIVGIYGMGGIGKTTVAKAVYNLMFRKFDGSSFLENVREVSKQPNGLVCLQNQLISDILMDKEEKQYVKNADRGIIVIQERLRRKRVFIVLDDIDQFDQLKALVGRGWFESGSKVIITTRDEHLLDFLQVDSKYKAKELNNDESIQLFSWHAFKKDHPKEDYVELSTNIVSYVKGLPLALEVLGSSLYGKTLPEWRSALEKIKRIPPNQVQRKLRISFDALDDYELKNIFLDIVCFFLGMDKNYVVKILDGCDFAAEYGIGVLCRRSLLTINKNNELRVHDLLRDMGRTIVHEESLEEIGKCSRLWSHEHAYDVLTNYSGTEKIQGISLTVPYGNRLSLTTEAFSKMKELRLLQVNYTNIIGDCKHFSKNLRWLCWHGCPLELIPINFDLKKLAVLDMQDSRIQRLWEETKMLENLKVLDLSYSGFLSELPNFSTFPNLEAVNLRTTAPPRVHSQSLSKSQRAALAEIADILKAVCHAHSLPLALTWIPCSYIDGVSDEFTRECIVEGNTSPSEKCILCIEDTACYVNDAKMQGFVHACTEHHLEKGQGIAGKALQSNHPFFSPDVKVYSINEYPLVHHARKFDLNSAVAIRLRSTFTGDDDYILEFFLPVNCKRSSEQQLLLNNLSSTMQRLCRSLRTVSDAELVGSEDSKLGHEKGAQENSMPTVMSLKGSQPALLDGDLDSNEMVASHVFNPRTDGQNADASNNQASNDPRKQVEKKRNTAEKNISLSVLQQYFSGSLKDAAKSIGVCPTTLKRICRQHGISRWPSRKINKVNRSLRKIQTVIDSVQGVQGGLKFDPITGEFVAAAPIVQDLEARTNMFSANKNLAARNPDPASQGVASAVPILHTKGEGTTVKLEEDDCSGSTQGVPVGNMLLPNTFEGEREKSNNPSVGFSHDSKFATLDSGLLQPVRCNRWDPHKGGLSLESSDCHITSRSSSSMAVNDDMDTGIDGDAQPSSSGMTDSSNGSGSMMNGSASSSPRFLEQKSSRVKACNKDSGLIITIKATYKDDTVRFKFGPGMGCFQLMDEIAKRFKLQPGTFQLKYLDDEAEWVLLMSDSDLQECLEILESIGSRSVKLMVRDLPLGTGSSDSSNCLFIGSL